MKVMHPANRWVALGVWVLVCHPQAVLGQPPDLNLPDGVCGNRQTMLEAAQAGNIMLQRTLAANMAWNEKSLHEYVNRLGQNLARTSGSEQPFTFYVVYNPVVNAEAFPGGYVVLNTGAISLAESEGELAAVLSHEIAHVNSCHWRSTGKGNLIELIALVPTVILGGPAGVALAAGSGWASTLARARFSRSDEERADRLAVEYLARAGYDPRAAPRFFQRLQAEEARNGGQPGGLLATHPQAADREKALEKFIPTLAQIESAQHDESEFLRMRRAVRNYDEIYSSVVGVRVPGRDLPQPTLSRR